MRPFWITSALTFVSHLALASETITDEPAGNSYNFVSHYSIEIDAPAERVWQHLTDLGSWMYDFEMKPISGFEKLEGQVVQLYEGQEFYFQIAKAIPARLMVINNLPTSMEGEQLSAGTSVTTLTEKAGKTTVNLTMNRRYTWKGAGKNHLKSRRQSTEFMENTRNTWKKFLERLAELSTF